MTQIEQISTDYFSLLENIATEEQRSAKIRSIRVIRVPLSLLQSAYRTYFRMLMTQIEQISTDYFFLT